MILAPIEATEMARTATIPTVGAEEICQTAARMRGLAPITPRTVANSLSSVIAAWRDPSFAPRRTTISAIAAAWGYSEPLLNASIDALLAPFTAEALVDFASARPALYAHSATAIAADGDAAARIIGMVMPGNLPGAGLHEVVLGLLSGRSLIIKTSVGEPLFFSSFARSLEGHDPALAKRIAVFNWSRERHDLSAALRANCDWFAAFGDDDTLRALERPRDACFEDARRLTGDGAEGRLQASFGERYSGAYIGADRANDPRWWRPAVEGLARDVTLFEQAGCLSPHQVFVEEGSASGPHRRAHQFAADLASALDTLAATLLPPTRLSLETAASLRRVREAARWRMLGGETVELWEGQGLSWTVIYDEQSAFTPSPGFRTITVSPVEDAGDLNRRLAPVAGRLEGFAIAGNDAYLTCAKDCLGTQGASYLCPPGMMQSPPLEWRHGGGAFLHALFSTIRDQNG